MKKILVVDDEPHIIRILKLALERAGYHVDSAANGMTALEKIQDQQPDILITDIQMPRMTGEELCKEISDKFPERTFLIIVTTSRTELEHREWAQKISNLIFLEKPLSAQKIFSILTTYFSKNDHVKGIE